MPRVYSVRDKLCPIDAVYIGRAGHGEDGRWGNPFTVKDYGRGGALEQYVQYLKQCISLARSKNSEAKSSALSLLSSLEELRGKDLKCFCAPTGGVDHADKPWVCHGQAILAYLAGEL